MPRVKIPGYGTRESASGPFDRCSESSKFQTYKQKLSIPDYARMDAPKGPRASIGKADSPTKPADRKKR